MNHMQNTDTLPPQHNGNNTHIETLASQPSRATLRHGAQKPKRARQANGMEPSAKRPLEKLAYNAAETCQVLGISRKTLSRLMERKLIRSLSVIRTHLFSRAELDRFLEESK